LFLKEQIREAGLRRLSMGTRDELVAAVGVRYRGASREEKGRILEEFVAVSGYCRKHAARLLHRDGRPARLEPRLSRRTYDDAVREALVVLWESSDRICGKRLKALIPMLVGSMEQHGHLSLDEEVRARLMKISAATIDRVLAPMRAQSSGRTRRRTAPSLAIRRSVPVRTFSDSGDPPPGFAEADLVAHSGPITRGSFIQTLVLTDVASGWTECAPLLFREQTLLREVLDVVCSAMPFPLAGFDTDNDSVFMNETVKSWCDAAGIVFTRSRPYRKNDQAHVEQKNGAVVRRMVGYRRFEGLEAAQMLAPLREHALVREFLSALVQAGGNPQRRRACAQALSPAPDRASTAYGGPSRVGMPEGATRSDARHARSREASLRNPISPGTACGDRRQDACTGCFAY
jgi:hypothetical protein